ncbi:hypothetical protein QQZ08_012563, partial [Neonectria magnoliae]
MGTGKTKTYLAAKVLHQRSLELRKNHGEDVEFRPTLILTPVNSLAQTYREAKEHFPDLNLVVYYGSKRQFTDPTARVLDDSKMSDFLHRTSSEEAGKKAKNGRYVIISTWPTWSARMIKTSIQQIVFDDGQGTASHKRRLAREGGESPPPPPGRRQRKQKIPLYLSTDKALEDSSYTTFDHRKHSHPDACIKTYEVVTNVINRAKFDWIIADEAH